MPAGRPTDYLPEYCEQLIAHMAQGYSFESFAGVLGVSKQTLYTWSEKHPEFLDAKNIATSKCRVWWERAGIEGLFNTSERDGDTTSSRSLNTGVWVFNMKNRFKEEWRDKHEEQEKEPQNAPKVIVYLPQNGRDPQAKPPALESKKKKKKK